MAMKSAFDRRVPVHSPQPGIADALDHLAIGVILTDALGCVLFANRSADEILKSGSGIRIAAGVLEALVPRETAALRQLIELAARGEAGAQNGAPSGVMSVSRPRKAHPLSIIVAPLRRRPNGPGPPQPAAILFVSDPEGKTDTSTDILMRFYGLTKSEAALALVLLEGHGLESAAMQLSMRMNTARTHLKQVFRKTRTSRQAELVRLILRSQAAIRFD